MACLFDRQMPRPQSLTLGAVWVIPLIAARSGIQLESAVLPPINRMACSIFACSKIQGLETPTDLHRRGYRWLELRMNLK